MATIRPRSKRTARGGTTRRLACVVAVLGIVAALGGSGARAEPKSACADNSLPIETLGSDTAQRQALYAQAQACVGAGKPQRAVALLTQIIKSYPTDATAYLNRGSAFARSGEVALALSDFGIALNLKPDLVEGWYDRGTLFTHMRRFEAAIADFTEAIRLKPDFALAYCNRGLANVQLGRFDDALADYSVAIGENADLAYCYFNRGNLYLTLGDYRKAIDDLTQALGERPENPVALTRRGQAFEALGEKSKALDDYRTALDADPNLESAKEGFARIMAEQQRSHRQD